MVPPAEAASKVKPFAKRAIELDGTLSETNTSYALLMTLYEWDHRRSLEYFELAIAADPNYAFAYHLESAASLVLGEHERSFAAEKRAIEIDPFTPIFNASLGWWYYIAGQNDRAVAQCKRTIEIAPNHFFAFWVLGLAFAREGAYSESVVAFQRALTLNQFEPHIRAELARVFAAMGETEEAFEILSGFEQLSADGYISPMNIAKIYVGLGDNEKVIEQLENACQEKAVRLAWLLVDPILEHLHDDSRYRDIRRRAGLPDPS